MSLPHPKASQSQNANTHGKGAGSTWNFPAAVAAWMLPGLGHFFVGEHRRAMILGTTIGSLWLGGVLIGGISVCSYKEHPAWFLGQMLTGPSLALDRYHHVLRTNALNGETAAYEPSYGAVSEQGILYTALAGLLNLLAIIDVVYRDPPSQAIEDDEREADPG